MKLRSVIIEELFGQFTHHIDLNTEDRITVIHGVNGVGKTTILRLVDALFSGRLQILRTTPYRRMILKFDDDRELHISRSTASATRRTLTIQLKAGRRTKIAVLRPDSSARAMFDPEIVEGHAPHLERIGYREWVDPATGTTLSMADIVERFPDLVPERLHRKLPSWLKAVLADLETHLIETQRLYSFPNSRVSPNPLRRGRPRYAPTVERYAMEMAEQIQEGLRRSGATGASLDRTFPHRLLAKTTSARATEERIRSRYKEQSSYRSRLMEAGLIEPEEPIPLPANKLGTSEKKVLWEYLNDVDKKLKLFDHLLQRVELFREIINARFQNKRVSIDKTNGLCVTTTQNTNVPLSALSSGEQHELVLAYSLLFIVKRGSLILVDEPELSLHITWQHRFIDDLRKISEASDLDFVLATHSPALVARHRSLMVALEVGAHA